MNADIERLIVAMVPSAAPVLRVMGERGRPREAEARLDGPFGGARPRSGAAIEAAQEAMAPAFASCGERGQC